MDRTRVSSSNVASVGYDSLSSTLEVEFHGGSIYQYFAVPSSVYAAMMSAASKGSYLAQFIKDRYHCRQVR